MRRRRTGRHPPPPAKRAWWIRHYTFTGTAVGLVFLFFSMTPSLLPRGPLFQGLVSGGAGAIGYSIGVFAVWLVRYMRSKDSSPAAPRWAWLGSRCRRRHRIDPDDHLVPPLAGRRARPDGRCRGWGSGTTRWPRSLSLITLFVFVEIGQLVGKLVRFLVRQLNRVAPPRVSAVVVGHAAGGVDGRASQRRGGAIRDEHHQQDLRGGQRRIRSRFRRDPNRDCARAGPSRWSAGSRWATRDASSSPAARRSSN